MSNPIRSLIAGLRGLLDTLDRFEESGYPPTFAETVAAVRGARPSERDGEKVGTKEEKPVATVVDWADFMRTEKARKPATDPPKPSPDLLWERVRRAVDYIDARLPGFPWDMRCDIVASIAELQEMERSNARDVRAAQDEAIESLLGLRGKGWPDAQIEACDAVLAFLRKAGYAPVANELAAVIRGTSTFY